MEPSLSGQPGELRATIHVTRKATGLVETFELIGHSDPEKLKEILQARKHHGASGAMVGELGGMNLNTTN
jgi:hypothetical protein